MKAPQLHSLVWYSLRLFTVLAEVHYVAFGQQRANAKDSLNIQQAEAVAAPMCA